MAERERELPATPAEARDALLDVFWDERNFMIAFGVVEVARMVLADPIQWQRALGWQHEYENRDDTLPVCLRCGVEITPLGPRLCPGESGPS